ncbi:helix-turn-helix domain-containing protein (plasmid) [Leptospira sp. WS60.C2]
MDEPFLLSILTGIIISFLSAISIFFDKASLQEKFGIFLLFFSIGMKQIIYFLWFSGLDVKYLFLHSVDLPFACCIGPLLFLYLQRIIDSKISSFKRFYLPFLPAFFSLFVILPYSFLPDSEKNIIIEELKEGVESIGYAFFILTIRMVSIIQISFYLSYFIFKTRVLVSIKSFVRERIIFHLFMIIVLTSSVLLLGFVAQLFFDFDQLKITHQIMAVIITAILFYLHLLVRRYPRSAREVNIEYRKVKYENSNLRNVDLDWIKTKLTYLIEIEKIYYDDELSLDKLANRLEIGTHQLSQYLNEIQKTTFYDLINRHRVIEAESLLIKYPDRTVLSIALQVGFSSLSTFYSAFGKKWKMSPNNFRKTFGQIDRNIS